MDSPELELQVSVSCLCVLGTDLWKDIKCSQLLRPLSTLPFETGSQYAALTGLELAEICLQGLKVYTNKLSYYKGHFKVRLTFTM